MEKHLKIRWYEKILENRRIQKLNNLEIKAWKISQIIDKISKNANREIEIIQKINRIWEKWIYELKNYKQEENNWVSINNHFLLTEREIKKILNFSEKELKNIFSLNEDSIIIEKEEIKNKSENARKYFWLIYSEIQLENIKHNIHKKNISKNELDLLIFNFNETVDFLMNLKKLVYHHEFHKFLESWKELHPTDNKKALEHAINNTRFLIEDKKLRKEG